MTKKKKKIEVMSDVHDVCTESFTAGYHNLRRKNYAN